MRGGRRVLCVKMATERKWAERVRAWRASGQDAGAFVEGKGYAASTLRFWSSRLGPQESVRIVPLVARPSGASRSATSARPSSLVVEVGGARLHVALGFDPALLADVVRALAHGGET